MEDIKFYIAPVKNQTIGSFIDLESTYAGLKYLSLTGATYRGKVKTLYSETIIEEEKENLYYSDNVALEQTDITLKLAFFNEESGTEPTDKYSKARDSYEKFMQMVEASPIIYYDTYRMRYLYMRLEEAIQPTENNLYGQPYLEASIKFKNIYGKAFANKDDINL